MHSSISCVISGASGLRCVSPQKFSSVSTLCSDSHPSSASAKRQAATSRSRWPVSSASSTLSAVGTGQQTSGEPSQRQATVYERIYTHIPSSCNTLAGPVRQHRRQAQSDCPARRSNSVATGPPRSQLNTLMGARPLRVRHSGSMRSVLRSALATPRGQEAGSAWFLANPHTLAV